MTLTIHKTTFQEHLQTASKFSSDKLNTPALLQGVYIKIEKTHIHLYATDLNVYCHIKIPHKSDTKEDLFIEPKKIIEFLQALGPEDITLETSSSGIKISQKTTVGNFPLLDAKDFPPLPSMKEKEQTITSDIFTEKLSKLLFSASQDEARPVLTGVNFVADDSGLTLITTDGFRLSVVRDKKAFNLPSMIIPSGFLREIQKYIKSAQDIGFTYSKEEQIVRIRMGESEFYTRLIEGEFPPYERVIPEEKKTTVTLQKDELLKNTKVISIFARDFSNIILFDFSEKGLRMSPKKEANDLNSTTQDIEFEGDPVRVAFNYRYLLDFLNNASGENVVIELLRSDTPTLFRIKGDDSFFHIIMPVRLQE